MKIILLSTILIVVSYTTSNCQQAVCKKHPNGQPWSDTDWKIGSAWNSSKVSPCHADAYYNCHGFVLSYFENGCKPSGYETPPYECPEAQGNQGGGMITTNDKILQVCDATQGNIVFYEVGSGYGTHSAVKATFGGATKYISKYGTDGPLVAHEIEGSYYHYIATPTIDGHYAYVGMEGDPDITGTGTVTFTAPSVSGATYSWSMYSGGDNIYIQSGANTNTAVLKPLHSGTAVLKLVTDHSCSNPKPQTLTLNIDTQICLEGTISNGSDTRHLYTGNGVAVGSVSTTVTCPNASTYTWTRTSGLLSYYASGNFMSFTMPSGNAVAFKIEAKNSSNQVIEIRNVAYYNYGSFAAFPNPTIAEFKIDVRENEELEIVAFRENNSKAVTQLKYCAKESVDVSQWEKGAYILHIYHKKELVKTERLIVQ